jgi:hypothetical protein
MRFALVFGWDKDLNGTNMTEAMPIRLQTRQYPIHTVAEAYKMLIPHALCDIEATLPHRRTVLE